MFSISRRFSLVIAICGALVAPLYVRAATIEVGPAGNTMTLSSNSAGTVNPIPGSDAFEWTGDMTNSAMGWHLNWDLTIDPDPSISGTASFTNITGATMNFTYTVSALSTEAILSPTVNGASTITVVDTDNDGATMASLPNDSIYDAFIQAASQQTLFNVNSANPYSLVAAPQGAAADVGIWGPQPATVPLAIGDVFGINHDFSLTPGDQATVNSNFFIIPEPTTLGLLVLGGMVMLRRRS